MIQANRGPNARGGKVVMIVVALIAVVSVSAASRAGLQASGQGEVLNACESALRKQTFN